MKSCVENGCHHLDISGEPEVCTLAYNLTSNISDIMYECCTLMH